MMIAAVSNLDNLGVGVALGVRGARIAAIRNLIIAAVTMVGTAVAMSSGRALSTLIPAGAAALIGSLIIIVAIGAGTVLASLFAVAAPTRRPVRPLDLVYGLGDGDAVVSHRDALVLGLALSLNNIGAGVGAGVAGVPPLATTLLAGALSLLCVGGGSSAARSLSRLFAGDGAQLMSGLVLLAVGGAMASGAL